jgi:hypothetical protein
MHLLTSERLAANAYRTLGLSASASQAEVNQAARRLRIWPDAQSVPPTPWDCEWLGPVRRSKIDIEQALSRINEPASRVQERLLWFHGRDSDQWDSAIALGRTLQSLASATDPISKHDFALARLCVTFNQDPGFLAIDRWRRVLTYLDELAESDDYLAQAIQIESDGDFEKRAALEEVATSIKAFPLTLASSIAAKAEAALEDDDVTAATRMLVLLRTAAPGSAAACESRIADRLEDLIVRRCNDVHQDLDKIGGKNVTTTQGQAICGGRARFYNESIDPLLTQLHDVAGPRSDRAYRARTAMARAMGHMGQCWAICGRMQIAEQTLEAALVLGQGTPVEQAIRENLLRCRQTMLWTATAQPAVPAPAVVSGQSYIPTYAVPKKPKRSFSLSGSGSGGWRGAGVLIGIAVAVIRGLTSFSGLGSSSPSAPSYTYPSSNSPYRSPSYPSPNFNQPAFSPPPSLNDSPAQPGDNPFVVPPPRNRPDWPPIPNPRYLEHTFPPLPGAGGSSHARNR